jgi:hypothetical protein
MRKSLEKGETKFHGGVHPVGAKIVSAYYVRKAPRHVNRATSHNL